MRFHFLILLAVAGCIATLGTSVYLVALPLGPQYKHIGTRLVLLMAHVVIFGYNIGCSLLCLAVKSSTDV